MTETNKLITLCFSEIDRLDETKGRLKYGYDDNMGICSCNLNNFFHHTCLDKDEILSFYLLGSLVDQVMYTHFNDIYASFREKFKFPKIYQHGIAYVMAHPSKFMQVKDPITNEEKAIHWMTMKRISEMIFIDIKNWFQESNNEEFFSSLKDKIINEIKIEKSNEKFKQTEKLLEIIEVF